MTGSTRSSCGLDDRRRRLLFRCWHRGTREMDLILGRFVDAEIADLGDAELGQLERLIELPDPDLYAALSGDAVLAPEYRSALFDRIKSRNLSAGRPEAGPVGVGFGL
jgi:antitoxin CptB